MPPSWQNLAKLILLRARPPFFGLLSLFQAIAGQTHWVTRHATASGVDKPKFRAFRETWAWISLTFARHVRISQNLFCRVRLSRYCCKGVTTPSRQVNSIEGQGTTALSHNAFFKRMGLHRPCLMIAITAFSIAVGGNNLIRTWARRKLLIVLRASGCQFNGIRDLTASRPCGFTITRNGVFTTRCSVEPSIDNLGRTTNGGVRR
ncbi:hypothetical protein BDN67DRAFT_825546 [Paxillus ammoniavirescens]|nr:hypothetical protein BDN67DRAFT_825546 [Paxillus ammoniavirescens]